MKKYIGIFSAFSETECQTGFLMLENTCIQYFPDAGLRISDRSQKFCLVNGGGLAKDNIDNDKYNGGNFSDICNLQIVVRSNSLGLSMYCIGCIRYIYIKICIL